MTFDFIQFDDNFKIKLIEFHKNTAACNTEALPYALLIGETTGSSLPSKISILSYCDNRVFEIGDELIIEPTKDPTKQTSMNPIYFVKDTIINDMSRRWVIGSENKAIWGRPKDSQ